jgi:hypothetical protein
MSASEAASEAERSAQRAAGERSQPDVIVFILVPGLYAAVEQADNPALRGRPVVVGADPSKRGTVTSASREARARGVHDGMETKRALELCPDAVLRPTRIERYREVAAELRALLRAETDRLEELGLEGNFLELDAGADIVPRVAELCVRVQAELGEPVGGDPAQLEAVVRPVRHRLRPGQLDAPAHGGHQEVPGRPVVVPAGPEQAVDLGDEGGLLVQLTKRHLWHEEAAVPPFPGFARPGRIKVPSLRCRALCVRNALANQVSDLPVGPDDDS